MHESDEVSTQKILVSSLRGALPRDAASAAHGYAATTLNTHGVVLHGERMTSGAAPGWEAGRPRPRRCPLVPGPRLPVGSPEGSAGRRAEATATTLLGRSPCLPSWRGGHFQRTTLGATDTRVGLKIRRPAHLAGAWGAQPVPAIAASPRPPRAVRPGGGEAGHFSKRRMQLPGIEPGSPAWQASIIPLDHSCCSMCAW